MLFGALEAGGTKMVCAVFDEEDQMLERLVVKTDTPEATMPALVGFFKAHGVKALGVASFGPLDLNQKSPAYGYIKATPKLAWRDYPLLPKLTGALNVPALIDTDVNGAALAEKVLGAAKGLESCLYVTVGTGIGGGVIMAGQPVHGLMHPELGHMLLRPESGDPMPDGVCPYHRGCLEGLASGTAIRARWGRGAESLPDGHPAWALESAYLAQMCANAIVAFSPEKIILGGGVMQNKALFPMIRERTRKLINGYVPFDAEQYIVEPGLDVNSGILGALLLAKQALQRA